MEEEKEESPELRGMPYMPLHGDRLFKSETWIKASAEAKVAMLRLWWQAFAHERPAGTLPNDDYMLAEYAGYGVMVEAFCVVKAQCLRGFELGADGRLHHAFVEELANRAWEKRVKSRNKQADYRRRKEAREAAGGDGHVPGDVTDDKKSGDGQKSLSTGYPQDNAHVTSDVTGDNGGLLPQQQGNVTVKNGQAIAIAIAKDLKPYVGQKPDGAGQSVDKSGDAKSIAVRVIEHLNKRAGTKYRASEAHLRLIRGRINADGATEELLCRVVDEKCAQAARGEFDRKWLSPDTLFNATKFAKYVGQLDAGVPDPAPGMRQRMVLVLGETATGDVATITTFSHTGDLNGIEVARRTAQKYGAMVKAKGYRYILIEEAGSQVKQKFSMEELS